VTPQRGRRHASRGQALFEMACILPLLLALFAGGYSITEAVTDDQLVNLAIGQSARYAAQIGNNGYSKAPYGCMANAKDPCEADKLIIGTLLPLLQQMISVSVQEIDIYQPQTCSPPTSALSGSCPVDVGYHSGSDLAERYDGSGAFLGNDSSGAYTLDLRVQSSPNQTSVGVSVIYKYVPPTHVFAVTLTQYSAYRLEPSS
jgi:hypothetical protein